tara:strand:- start:34 stop:144 length:111 start_codon:yes stop_codon:yes gene_type:complete
VGVFKKAITKQALYSPSNKKIGGTFKKADYGALGGN